MNRRMTAAVAFQDLLAQRLTRRQLLGRAAAVAPLALGAPALLGARNALGEDARQPQAPGTLSFQPIQGSAADAVVLPSGYTYDMLIRWGESLAAATPDLDADKLPDGVLFGPHAAEHQRNQFGQNCDAIHFFALDASGARGVLCVNNEYTDDALMFPGHPGFKGLSDGATRKFVRAHPALVPVAQAAQGVSVIEVVRERGRWRFLKDSKFNRRITATTPIEIGGPARGAALMRTKDDPHGVRALGTFGNCAGGRTPWGAYLTAEENIQDYFGDLTDAQSRGDIDPHVLDAHRRFRMWSAQSPYGWETVDPRFHLPSNPTEPFRFGWIVEIDPLDPARAPVKRTALGRFAHEGASPVVANDGRIAVYMGDDDKFEHAYKFVSHGRFDPKSASGNRDLLDHGTLFVARFDASGAGQWLPLVFDPKGPLNAQAGFKDQAEVLIKARAAASVLGATPMDRPEDIEVNPASGRIYIACTRNEQRGAGAAPTVYAGRAVEGGVCAANPREHNAYGHIIEIREVGDDHTAREFTWEVFLLAGDPAQGKLLTELTQVRADSVYYAGYGDAEDLSPIGCPDNLAFDNGGNLWIVTDGPQPRGANDGCWAAPTSGALRGRLQQFMSGPVGAEVCGCCFTPDNETLFLSIQHPGEGGSLAAPLSRWPDGPGAQPRSSVIAVRKQGGGVVGS